MDTYNRFAEVYDRLISEDIDYDAWCGYITELFDRRGAAPRSVCELACGTGSISVRLSERGYELTGVDISGAMLKIAEKKARGARFICSDMSRFVPDKEYDAFLCMIDGINYVVSPKALLRTFDNVRGRLKKDGVFIFDISTRHKLRDMIGGNIFLHSEYDLFYSWQNRYIERFDLSDMLLNFFVRRGNLYERFEERHLQRGYSEKEIITLLRRAGFSQIDVYDELGFDPPNADSERIVFVCG